MYRLASVVVTFASLIGGAGAVLSGDWGVVVAAIMLAALGMIPVSILLIPGTLVLGWIVSKLDPRTLNSTEGPGIWMAAILGTLHSSVVQILWVIGCALILGGATDGSTPSWAIGLLWVGASYGVWAWLAGKDLRAGNAASSIQLAHYALGLVLLYLTFLLATDAVWLAFVLLVGAQLSAVPRIIEFERGAAAQWRMANPTAAFFSDFYAAEEEVADPSEWPRYCPECGEPTGPPPGRPDRGARFCKMCGSRLN